MDEELERLKQKRLQELQREMLLKQIQESQTKKETEKPKEQTDEEVLNEFFKDRAWEVWNAAKQQYPELMPKVEKVLVDALKQGKFNDKIDGSMLMEFFRHIGLMVHLNTRIRISEHGKLKTLEQKLNEEK
jgi:DNA-binding TFAR19-related protein (PDSD5 family)